MVYGFPWWRWLLSLLIAIFVFILVKWAGPLILALVGVVAPDILVVLFALILAVFAFLNGYWAGNFRGARTP